jgi:ABC-2 type transport system ATP-binding protein
MPELVVETHQLTKRFNGAMAIEEVSLHVPKGSIFGFIGPSGCGKTTTVRLLTGIYEPTYGDIRVLGHDPKRYTQSVRARIGYMPQHFVLYPDLSVQENLNFAASIYGVGIFQRSRRIRQLLEFVELEEHRHKLARNISGGMQRRLSLAATLVHNPELLFLDEPTAGIDPVLRRRLWDHFQQMQREERTLFITTQYVGEAAYCDYVGVMANGWLLFVDTPQGLRHRAFGGAIVDLTTDRRLSTATLQRMRQLPPVRRDFHFTGPSSLRLTVDNAATAIPEIMSFCQTESVEVESIQEYTPPFDDVFVELVKEVPVRE